MQIKTTVRDIGCLGVALNLAPAEPNHSGRVRKDKAYEQFLLDEIEERPGVDPQAPVTSWPKEEVVLDVESGVVDYLIERFGGEGEIKAGGGVERSIMRLVEQLIELKRSKPVKG